MAFDVVIFSLSFLVLNIVCDLLQLPYELNLMFLSYFFLIFPFLCFLLIHWIFSISVLNSVMLWVPFRFKLHYASPALPLLLMCVCVWLRQSCHTMCKRELTS
jgi:hypothetical protein